MCTVYSQCGYGHVSSNYHFGRIVLHMYHIYMVSPLCGYGHVSPYYHYVRIVHNRYHICMVYAQCGYRYGSSNYHFVKKKKCTTSATFKSFLNSTSVYIHSHSEYTSTATLFPFTKVCTTVWKHTGVYNVILHKTLRHNQQCTST